MNGVFKTLALGAPGRTVKLLILMILFSFATDHVAFAFPWKTSKSQGKAVSASDSSPTKSYGLKTQPSNRLFAEGSEDIQVTSNELTVPVLQSLSRRAQDLPNLRMVSGQLLRGGQPSQAGLNLLKQAGVKSIIDLRAEEPKAVEVERKTAERLGMKFIHIPMYAFDKPDSKQFNQFLSAVANSENRPVYVHCLHGRDRTGTMIGAYRIMFENWTFDNAFKEMMACGYRPGLANMTRGLHDLAVSKGDKSPLPSASFVAADLRNRLQKFSKRNAPVVVPSSDRSDLDAN